MRYYGEMRSEHGFDDGERTPEEAHIYLQTYVKAINAVAEVLKSRCRAVRYDGAVNPHLILVVPLDTLNAWTRKAAEEGVGLEVSREDAVSPDNAFEAAESICQELYLDAAIEITVTVDEEELTRAILEGTQIAEETQKRTKRLHFTKKEDG